MNRNVVSGALLALAVVAVVLVSTGGRKAQPAPVAAPVQQAPIPSLDGVQSEPAKPTPAESKPADPAPAQP